MELLLPHWYGARFGTGLLHAEGVPQHFRRTMRLVESVGVRRLVRPVALDRLDEVAELVERDTETEPQPAA